MNAAERAELHSIMTLLLDKEPLVDYPPGDHRGSLDAMTWSLNGAQMKSRLAQRKHIQMDCSQGIACVYKWAGMENPSGNIGWPGTTATLLERYNHDKKLKHYTDASAARVGAICIFGEYPGEHGALVLEPGRDPWLWSHGMNRGPIRIRLSAEKLYHPHQPVTFLNVSGLGPAH